MRIVDTAVLARVRATGLTVHDGLVPSDDPDANVVTVSLPYCVFYSSLGDDADPRLTGQNGRRSVFFQLTYVGGTREQAKWAGEKQRLALADVRLSVPGVRTWLVGLEESQRVRRDDDAVRPDGTPLFYGVDTYAVSITLINH